LPPTSEAQEDCIPCLLNPKAGSARTAVERISEDERFQLRECTPDELVEVLREEAQRGTRRLVVSGGDGTIAAAAGVLAGTEVELGILPGGTLNHFARSLGIPTELDAALDVAVSGPCRGVDVGYVNDRLFLNTSSVGAYVAFVHTREAWEPRLGYLGASAWAALRMLARLPMFSVEVETDGEWERYTSPLVFVGVDERELRFPTFGERVEDGRPGLHLLVVHGTARARLFAMMLAATAGGIRVATRTPHLDSFFGESCTIDLPRSDVDVAVDGETIRLATPLRYRFARAALNMVVPPDHGSGDLEP
jgi:diacylglycerol kinase family enzyme